MIRAVLDANVVVSAILKRPITLSGIGDYRFVRMKLQLGSAFRGL